MKALSLQNFLGLIFDKEDQTCFTDSPYGTQVSFNPKATDIFFCINALDPYQDLKPEKQWHRQNKPRRADHNVLKHRTFLLEMDKGSLDEQRNYIASRVPYSAVTFSGGKSLHFLLTLETPVSAEQYRKISKQLLTLLPEADRATKNPSRLSRLPFRQRPDGKFQELLELRERIPNHELLDLLPEVPEVVPLTRDINNPTTREFMAIEIINASSNPDDFMNNIRLDGRNNFFFYLGARMRDLDYDKNNQKYFVDLAYNNLKDKSGFSYEEALNAARLK